MKIDYAIMSSDSNPMYLDFWPTVSKLWKKKFNIEPILIYIDEDQEKEISTKYGTVLKLKPIKNIPISIQTLWSRYWLPIQYPENVCIISDIDMLPLSEKYFIDNIKNIKDDKYVHLNPCIESYGMIPSCYHVAKGSMFEKVLKTSKSLEESLKNLHVDFGNPRHQLEDDYWFLDEEYASKSVIDYKKNNPEKVIFLQRDFGQNGKRIDRADFEDGIWDYSLEDLKLGKYYDCHSIRPYQEYKNHIDKISKIALKSNLKSFKEKFIYLTNTKNQKFLKDLILWTPEESTIFNYEQNNEDISYIFKTTNDIKKCDSAVIKLSDTIDIQKAANFFIKQNFKKSIFLFNISKKTKDLAKLFCEKLKVNSNEELQWIFKGDYVIVLPIDNET